VSERSRGPDTASDRALALAIAGATALALCAMFWPAALRRVFVYLDLGGFVLPTRLFLAENLARGTTPLWMPNLYCGYYAHGEGVIGIFHPARWLLYRFLPFTEAFNLECLIPYPLALIGFALFLRRLALPASAAIFGGASFALCAYLTLRLTHPNVIAVLAHLGWLLLAIDVLIRGTGRARWGAWVGLAIATGSQLLLGYPAAVAYCWLIAIPHALYTAHSRRAVAPLAAVATAIIAGVLIAAVQLVPTYDYLASSDRGDQPYGFLTLMSVHPLNLVSVVAPWMFENGLYMDRHYDPLERALYFGPVVPIAALWVAIRWRRLGPLRPVALGLFGLCAISLLLSLGQYTVFYRYFLELPGAGWLRVPARYSFVLYVAGAFFAAIAFAELARGDPSPEARRGIWWIWIVPALSWLAAGVALAFALPGVRAPILQGTVAEQLDDPVWIALGPLVFTAAAALFTAAARGHRAALYGLALLALADQVAYALTLWWIEPPRTVAEYVVGIQPLDVAPSFRFNSRRAFKMFAGSDGHGHEWSSTRYIVHDLRQVSGYSAQRPSVRLDYTKLAALRVAGASFNLEVPDRRVAHERAFVGPLPGALPRARLVADAVVSAQPAHDIEAIDVERTALVDEPVELDSGPAGAAAIEQDLPGSIRIAVEAPARRLLVLAESFHPGWRAQVDGAPARALRVNGDFLGVVVGAAAREVEFRFAPRSFAVGCWISAAGVAAVLAVALAGLRFSS
jgi:hypothetical protein